MRKTYLTYYFITLLIGILAVGCNRHAVPQGPVPQYDLHQAYEALRNHNVDFDWWVGKGKVNVDSPDESGSGKTYLRIKSDSLIWMVAKKIGVEGMRMFARPDSFWIKYPLIKEYQRGDVNDFLSMYDMSLDYLDFQQILAGNVMLPDTSKATFVQEGREVVLDYSDSQFSYKYRFEPYTLHLQRLIIMDYMGRRVDLSYEDYKKAENIEKVLPHKRSIVINDRATLKYDFSEILINVPKNTPFSINSRYREVGI